MLISRRLPVTAALAALTVLAACRPDDDGLVTPALDAPAPPTTARVALVCAADASAATLACEGPEPDGPAGISALIVGGQDQLVALASPNVCYEEGCPGGTDGDEIFQADVTVQNLIPQPLGTADGASGHAEGVRVFFTAPPAVTGCAGGGTGCGPVTMANADDLALFTESDQPFFQYGGTPVGGAAGTELGTDRLLSQGETSARRTWRWNVPSNVATFAFTVYVSAAVQHPNGWAELATTRFLLAEGEAATAAASVFDVVGHPLSEAVSFSSTDELVFTAGAATGALTAVGYGTALLEAAAGTAESAPGTDTARVGVVNGTLVSQVLTLDGTDDYVDLPAGSVPSGAGTIEHWIHVSEGLEAGGILLYTSSVTDEDGFSGNPGLEIHTAINAAGAAHFTYQDGSSHLSLAGATPLATGRWHHVAVAYDVNGQVTLYVNGEVYAQAAYGGSTDGHSPVMTRIGRPGDPTRFFEGSVDEVRTWSAVLDHATIRQWMNEPVTDDHPNFDDLVGYWPFDEASGTTVRDLALNDHHGSLRSGAARTGRTASFLTFSPDPYATDGSGSRIAGTTAIAATFDGPVGEADSDDFVVHGSMSGLNFIGESYGGAGTSTVTAPAGSFFPGEEIEVTLTGDLHGTAPRVARYRVATPVSASGFASAVDFHSELGDSARSIAAGDVNGDGNLDLVLTTKGPDSDFGFYDGVIVWEGDGLGGFSGGQKWDAGSDSSDLVAADLDGDGHLDLAVANRLSDDISILLNDGDGTFVATTGDGSYTPGGAPVAVATGDLDGDGDLDLAAASVVDPNISVLLNERDGTFVAGGNYDAGQSVDVAVGDMNGDGHPDLVAASLLTGELLVLLNAGDGTFDPALAFDAPGPRSITLADLDGDGDLDAATATAGFDGIFVALNLGNGHFPVIGSVVWSGSDASEPRSVAVGDFNGDGRLDMAAAYLHGWAGTTTVGVALAQP